MNRFRDRIRQIHPLSELSSEVLDELLEAGKYRQYARGDVLFREGDEDDRACYLLEGSLKLTGDRSRRMDHDTPSSNYAVGNLRPRPFTATVVSSEAWVLELNQRTLEAAVAREQVTGSGSHGLAVSDLGDTGEIDSAWMFRMMRSPIFKALPIQNVERLFLALEPVEKSAGEVVLTQGEEGDFYYMIVRGQCQITREEETDREVARLGPGECFGEEALISEAPRNATATMLTDGVLMKLTKADFKELLVRPIISAVPAERAIGRALEGSAVLIDVRGPEEHEAEAYIPSRNLPLDELRERISELDPEIHCIAYCDTGARSSTAAFLLSERGFRASYVREGLSGLLADA